MTSAIGGFRYRLGHFTPKGILLRLAGNVWLCDARELVSWCLIIVVLCIDWIAGELATCQSGLHYQLNRVADIPFPSLRRLPLFILTPCNTKRPISAKWEPVSFNNASAITAVTAPILRRAPRGEATKGVMRWPMHNTGAVISFLLI